MHHVSDCKDSAIVRVFSTIDKIVAKQLFEKAVMLGENVSEKTKKSWTKRYHTYEIFIYFFWGLYIHVLYNATMKSQSTELYINMTRYCQSNYAASRMALNVFQIQKHICLQNYPIKIIEYPMCRTKNMKYPFKNLFTQFKEKIN